jgi:hypothetical protein
MRNEIGWLVGWLVRGDPLIHVILISMSDHRNFQRGVLVMFLCTTCVSVCKMMLPTERRGGGAILRERGEKWVPKNRLEMKRFPDRVQAQPTKSTNQPTNTERESHHDVTSDGVCILKQSEQARWVM